MDVIARRALAGGREHGARVCCAIHRELGVAGPSPACRDRFAPQPQAIDNDTGRTLQMRLAVALRIRMPVKSDAGRVAPGRKRH